MPKRSLHPGSDGQKKVEQLNQAVDGMLARNDGKPGKVSAEIKSLLSIAAEMRNLPRESFKARLKSDLEGKKHMSAVAETLTAQLVTKQSGSKRVATAARPVASPNLTFRDAAKAIAFYEKALGAKEQMRFEAGGHIPHAEITIGDSTIVLSDEWREGGRFSAETLGHSPISLSIQVDDVDAFSGRAVAAGMKVIRPLKDQFYGIRDTTLADPFGYSWNLRQVKEEMSVEEMHRRHADLHEGPEGGVMPPRSKGEKGVRPIPSGFRMVTPYLVAEDGPALLDFAKQAFGAEETLRAETPMGIHGEVRIGDSMLMMGGGVPGKKFPATFHPNALHVYVEDADAVVKRAVEAGATLIGAPRDQDYGERSGTVKDKAGNFWYIATHKGESHIPRGLHSVNAYLHPRRAEPLIGFLKRAFGAEEVAKYATPEGVVIHAQIRVGDSVLEMGEAHGQYEPIPAMFYLYVPDVDTSYKQAVAAGGVSFQEPTDQFYGDRSAGVKDNFGNIWYIATHIRDVDM